MSTPSRRAPRLGPRDRIAPHLARRGRFAKLDPLRPRKPPGAGQILGAVAWAALLAGTLYRAWAVSRRDGAAAG
jgi:hypothetical protein